MIVFIFDFCIGCGLVQTKRLCVQGPGSSSRAVGVCCSGHGVIQEGFQTHAEWYVLFWCPAGMTLVCPDILTILPCICSPQCLTFPIFPEKARAKKRRYWGEGIDADGPAADTAAAAAAGASTARPVLADVDAGTLSGYFLRNCSCKLTRQVLSGVQPHPSVSLASDLPISTWG